MLMLVHEELLAGVMIMVHTIEVVVVSYAPISFMLYDFLPPASLS